ncbi:MAG: SpoIIE family protein phosphatase [Pirellulales bacterium]
MDTPYLQVLAGTELGRKHSIVDDRMVLGRHPECDIVLDSAAVSRQHAALLRTNGEYYIEDLGSRNGTFLNGQLVQGRQELEHGDRLRICDLTLEFFAETPATATVKLSAPIGPASDMAPALLIDDDALTRTSTITSRLDVTGSQGGVRLTVRPEVKLKALLEIMQSLSKTLLLDEVLPRLLDGLFKIFVQADRGFVVLRSPRDGTLIPRAVKHRRPGTDDSRISRTIVNKVIESKTAILSADAASDERFDMSQSIVEFRIRSMMCAPIVNGDDEVLGVIQIDTLDQRSRFQEDDLEVLVGVALQAAIAIDNAQLHAQAIRQQQVQHDLDLAHKVQQSMLPVAPAAVEGYCFFDFYRAAREVGGDYYDYVELPDGRIAVVVADVSGKGIAAALLMARLSSDVRYCLASAPSPATAIRRLNAGMARSAWEDRFVTMVMAVLDPREHVVTIVNAGHMPPILRIGDSQATEIGGDQSGLPLGVLDDYEFEQVSVELPAGSFLTLYTDGISEAMNPQGDIYGLERIHQQVAAPITNVADLGRHILDDVKQFVGQREQSDDMCLACFGRVRSTSKNKTASTVVQKKK